MQERWNADMKVVIVGGVAGGYRCRPYSQTE